MKKTKKTKRDYGVSPYDLTQGNKGLPALVRSHKKRQRQDYERLYGKTKAR